MSCDSGTELFDSVVEDLLISDIGYKDFSKVVKSLIYTLQGLDCGNMRDSEYLSHPRIKPIMKSVYPDLYDEDSFSPESYEYDEGDDEDE